MSSNDLPLTVVENDDGSFTFDWDDNHPITSVMNNWTEEDFVDALRAGLTDRSWRTEFAVDEFQDNFDELFARVENGETLTIVNSDGQRCYMMPLDTFNQGKTT